MVIILVYKMGCHKVSFEKIDLLVIGKYIKYLDELKKLSDRINGITHELEEIFGIKLEGKRIRALWIPCKHQNSFADVRNITTCIFSENYPEEDRLFSFLNVLAHEISHIFDFNVAKSWKGSTHVLFNEGFAQYFGYRVSRYKNPSLRRDERKIWLSICSTIDSINLFDENTYKRNDSDGVSDEDRKNTNTLLFIGFYESLINIFGESKTWEFLRDVLGTGSLEYSCRRTFNLDLRGLNDEVIEELRKEKCRNNNRMDS